MSANKIFYAKKINQYHLFKTSNLIEVWHTKTWVKFQ